MSVAALVVAASLSALSSSDIESSATRTVALSFERVGRRTPVRDEALSVAARELAKEALASNARSATELVAVTEAVSFSGGWDPSPKILVVKGSPRDEPLRLLGRRTDLAADPATHVGIGAVTQGNASAVVILLSQRRARLEPFLRRHPKPVSPRELCGALEAPLGVPEVVVTRPDGTVARAGFSTVGTDRFCARLPLAVEGRYTVELLGRGPKGPEVAALFFVDVGATAARAGSETFEEPADAATARGMIVDRINALRRAHGLSPLVLDETVSQVAQRYSDKMAQERFFAHVSPEGSTVGQRLRDVGYAFRGAGENLGMASGPLAAHFGIEHSPGHRKNLIDPKWSRVGIGVAERMEDGSRQVLVTQVFVDPLQASADPLADAHRAINQRRAELKLSPLERNATLDALAREHARKALALDEPRAELPGAKLHDQVFAALDDASSASVDFFVADNPSLIQASKSANAAGHKWVGIGAVKGDSPKLGKGKYWVVVIYASKR